MTRLLLTALLAIYPHTPHRHVIEQRFDAISSSVLDASKTYGVPPSILLAVGFLESQLGTDPRSGGSLGAPIDRRHRGVAGGWTQQASSLALGYRRCHAWLPALRHFRCGRCDRCPVLIGYTPETAMHLSQMIETRAAQ